MPFRFLLCFFVSSFFIPSRTLASGFAVPVSKDATTLLYSLPLYLKTPPQRTQLHLDLGASFTWLDCDNNYTSSTYQHISCGTPLCTSVGFNLACSNCDQPPSPTCANNTCGLFPENSVTQKATISIAIIDSLALPTSDESTQGSLGFIPEYIFSCAPASLRKGLPKISEGVAAFGRSNYSLTVQVSRGFSTPNCFALCLSPSTSDSGVAFFGSSGPYYFSPQNIDLSKSLTYTPLLLNPVGGTIITYNGKPSDEYFIGLTSIKVNGKPIPINGSLLAINDENGFGGTKLSTSTPHSILESSIYKAFTDAFLNESAGLNLTVTNAVDPFTVCYPVADVINTRVGPAVPTVDLVMQSDDVFWRIFGANSMTRITKDGVDVWCLGFVDGGVNPRTAIVIGGHQIEDNLLQFDLESKRLGFSSSVVLKGTTCDNFNFKTKKGND
ncbi:hypothetical protein SLA2020_326240 [Shorea laevis]